MVTHIEIESQDVAVGVESFRPVAALRVLVVELALKLVSRQP